MARPGRRGIGPLAVALELLLVAGVLVAAITLRPGRGDEFYTSSLRDAEVVPAAAPAIAGASTGSYTWDCGRNERGHRNTANIVVTPLKPGSQHHLHDYIGNLGVRDDSTVDDLVGKPTTCTNGDASTYFWPVLRTGTADDGGHGGPVLVPTSVTMTYVGNPRGRVLPMPRLLRVPVGDAYAHTNGGRNARVWWSCTNTPDRRTAKYPLCDEGAAVVRIFDFPSCWDGRRLDSPDHRQQVVFPAAGGGCPVGTFAIPRLRITMTYAVPPGVRYRVDAFDGQRNDPATDHGFLVNLMPQKVMNRVVACLNEGRTCEDGSPS